MRLLLLLLTLVTCGCHYAGEWVDDPHNLSRAWGKSASQNLHAIHSSYWRSSHFTREEVYFFQLPPDPRVKSSFIQANQLVPTSSKETISGGFSRPRPPWFAPGSPDSYSAWAPQTNETHVPPNILILEDRKTGSLFIYGCQL